VMLAGITVNIVLGIVIFWVLTVRYGESYIPNADIKYGIVPGKIGERIGLRPGDKITAINGKRVVRFDELTSTEVILGNSVLTVQRGGQTLDVKVPSNILNDLSDLGIDQFIGKFPRAKFSVEAVEPNSGAQKIGLAKNDSIVGINTNKIAFFDQLQAELQQDKGKQVLVSIKRGDNVFQKTAQIDKSGILGFLPNLDIPKEKKLTFGFFGSLPVGATKAWGTFTDDAKGIGKVVTGDVKFSKAVSGPVKIATLFGTQIDWIRFWSLVGFLSMVLALTNLLPIPALDGGHAMFLLIEMIKGKPLSDKFLERAQIVGFVILISLMVFVFGNDIVKQVVKK